MRDLLTVMEFTMKEMVKRKSFIISTIVIIVLMIIGFNVPNIIKSIKGDSSKDKILVVDSENIFEGNLDNLNKMGYDMDFEITNENLKFEDIKKKIENDEIEDAMIITRKNDKIKVSYIVENANMMDGVPQECQNALTSVYTGMQIKNLGLTQEELMSLVPNFDFELEQTEEKEVKGNVLVMMLLSLVLFYAIYFCAYQVSSSITTEKTSKIMETLVTSTSPKTIVLGKTIGVGIVGLIQVSFLTVIAFVCAKSFLDPELIENALDLSNITGFLAVVTAIYFVLGYFTYALIYALTGSTVSKPEDIQSANTPASVLAVIGFYLSYFTMMNPTSELNGIAAILPISSPFCMPFRVMMGIASTKDVLISILVLVITILIIAKVAIKIYSNAILNYGSKLSFKDVLKIYKDKNNSI